ncbi:hypothetical protein TNCV_2076801 [Trichonephila clavipes]|nr:hypothetical protein TNCV_2076801 [Trichonephila clavipes]
MIRCVLNALQHMMANMIPIFNNLPIFMVEELHSRKCKTKRKLKQRMELKWGDSDHDCRCSSNGVTDFSPASTKPSEKWRRLQFNGTGPEVLSWSAKVSDIVASNSHRAVSPLLRLAEGEERWEASDYSQGVLPQNRGGTQQIHTVTCMVLKSKADDRRKNLTHCPDAFREP